MTVRYPDLNVKALLAYTEDLGTLAELLGVTRRTLHRYERSGLTIEQADMFAVRLGLHAAEVWPAWHTDLAAAAHRRAEADRIAALRASNPDYAERNRRYSFQYWLDHREAMKAARRRRYERNAERERARARERRRLAKESP